MKSSPFKGFYISLARMVMRKNMYSRVFKGLFILHMSLAVFLCLEWVDFHPFGKIVQLIMSEIWAGSGASVISLDIGGGFLQYDPVVVRNWLRNSMTPSCYRLGFIFMGTGMVYLATFPIFRFFRKISRQESQLELVRGAEMIFPEAFNKKIRKTKEAALNLGNLLMPHSMTPEHLIAIAKSGGGKTTLLFQMFEQVKNQSRGIVYDRKGDYTERFYDPSRDLIFNPCDERCMGWNIFSELKDTLDVVKIGSSSFPDSHKERDPYWRMAGRDVVMSLLNYLWLSGKRTNKDVWEAVCAGTDDIRKWLSSTPKGRPGYRHIEGSDGQVLQQTGGVLSSVMQFMRGFEYLQDVEGTFSIAEWIRSGKGWIFISNTKKVEPAIRPVLSLFIDLVGYNFLDLPDDSNRRFYYFLDELPTLPHLNTLVELCTLSRSRGGALMLGAQDMGQLWSVYGKDTADTLFNNTGTKVILKLDAPESNEYISKYLGEQQIVETIESISTGPDDKRSGMSFTRQKRTDPIILPSQISSLPNLHGFAKIGRDLTTIELTPKTYPVKNQPFILRKSLKLDPNPVIKPEDPLSF